MTLHRDLQLVVDWSWKKRADLMNLARGTGKPKGLTHYDPNNQAMRSIYGYICGLAREGVDHNREISDRQMNMFAEVLDRKLTGKLTPLPTYKLQRQNWRVLANLRSFPEPATWIAGFIHVIKPTQAYACRERVYVHLKEKTRANAFSAILKKIWHLDGVLSAKVAAPGAEKTDTVLVYCKDGGTRNEVIKIIAKYRKKNLRYFGSELPLLVAQVGTGVGHAQEPKTTGIGYGSEPPARHFMRPDSETFLAGRKQQSFGTYRAMLVFIALERTMFPEDMPAADTSRQAFNFSAMEANPRHAMRVDETIEQNRQDQAFGVTNMVQKLAFEQEVEEMFRLAGLDPENPQRQGKPLLESPIVPPKIRRRGR